MTEHNADEQPRKGSTAPGLEGEGGQYVDGDYGDAGTVGDAAAARDDGEYEDGDYGEAGTAGRARETDAVREGLTDGQVNTTAEERGPLHGRRDSER
ncbi:hypothetical protein FHJ30_18760 [Arthrobacter sp. BB-1]|uniref:hypothetical protein n=1 Tax=unclassified Arthrobacter TaxID=235627 RepID=UPI0010F255DF|nr:MULTISPECIES: hypothetical protein [unclassified Arthrobacter]TNB69615.1 hypothetical protein FHJ30_18760 [Arthrobacter sp. BB-1]VII98165.1 hypothetical protein [Arthrobacter sp. DR-2P]